MAGRDPERIDDVLEQLEEYWKANPDLRLAQIVCNAHSRSPLCGDDPFYMEDDEFIRHL